MTDDLDADLDAVRRARDEAVARAAKAEQLVATQQTKTLADLRAAAAETERVRAAGDAAVAKLEEALAATRATLDNERREAATTQHELERRLVLADRSLMQRGRAFLRPFARKLGISRAPKGGS